MCFFPCLCYVWLRVKHCTKRIFEEFKILIFSLRFSVFVDIGLKIVAACGRCWDAVPAKASTSWLVELFESGF